MQRRRLIEQTRSRFAVWARRLAIFSVPVVLLAIIMAHAGQFEALPILVTFGSGLLLALLAILLAIAALIGIWIDGRAGAGYALAALGISFLLLAYPAYFATKAYRLPPINDVTTDANDPPRLEAAQRLRQRSANATTYGGPAVFERQQEAYPDIAPVSVEVPPQMAYDAAYGVVTKRKWVIVNARPPQAGGRDGVIEAVARTPIMGFREDIAIRIRREDDGAKIDVRSASRFGRHDFGSNAARIKSLLDDIDDRLTADNEKAERAAQRQLQQQQKQKPPAGKDAKPPRRP